MNAWVYVEIKFRLCEGADEWERNKDAACEE